MLNTQNFKEIIYRSVVIPIKTKENNGVMEICINSIGSLEKINLGVNIMVINDKMITIIIDTQKDNIKVAISLACQYCLRVTPEQSNGIVVLLFFSRVIVF